MISSIDTQHPSCIAHHQQGETSMSTHRHIQLAQLAYSCECLARSSFRAAHNAHSINNRAMSAHFQLRAAQALRIAQRASLRIGA
jgi:hypothetical protein